MWLSQWESHIPVLERAKELGMDPEALKTRPTLPWYYQSMLRHFNTLSFSRPQSQFGPLPIDILTIFSYNERIVHMDDSDFLEIIFALDVAYFKSREKKQEEDDGSKG